MKYNNPIGLDPTLSKRQAERRIMLPANRSIFYKNTKNYRWNIRGNACTGLQITKE